MTASITILAYVLALIALLVAGFFFISTKDEYDDEPQTEPLPIKPFYTPGQTLVASKEIQILSLTGTSYDVLARSGEHLVLIEEFDTKHLQLWVQDVGRKRKAFFASYDEVIALDYSQRQL